MTQSNEKIENESVEVQLGRALEENQRLQRTIDMLNDERRRDKEYNRRAFDIIDRLSRALVNGTD